MNINIHLGNTIHIPIIYINLDKDMQRKKSVENICNYLDINCTRFSAITSNNINNYKNLVINKTKMNNNEIACSLSHLSILSEYQKQKYIIVFEDDIQTYANAQTFKDHVQRIISLVPNFDIVYFGQAGVTCKNTELIENPLYRYKGNSFCAHAYMISKKGIKKILQELPINKPIDLVYRDILNKKGEAYVTLPSMITQNILNSTSNSRKNIDYPTMSDCIDKREESKFKYIIFICIILLPLLILFIFFKRNKVYKTNQI